MTPERWARIEEVFEAALDVPLELRSAYVRQACAGDEELQRDVERLLAEERNPSFRSPVDSELSAGATVGRYRVEAKLGQGGMGAVYKAHDTLLGRPVALKILFGWPFADGESRGRLVQEARAASVLSHPNIVTIFDAGSEGSIDFIAMEYVEGKPLSTLISERRLSLEEAVRYALEMVDGLAAAHAKGVVHRDIKPANILIIETGHVKILDFGVAKILSATGAKTTTGAVIGTAAYMSPEQAEAGPVDARSDIYSFGAVLYEMVTGRMAAHAPRKPARPAELERIIAKCLRTDPARRFQHMDDVGIELADIALGPARRGWKVLWAALAVLVVAAGAAWFITRHADNSQSSPVLKQLTTDTSLTYQPALSPDGGLIAYSSDRGGAKLDIWVQHLPRGEPIRLTNDAGNNREPSFSPDGGSIVFVSDREGSNPRGGGIYIIPTLGGQATKIVDEGRRPRFSPDGKWIAYWAGDAHSAGETYVVPATGGTPRVLSGFGNWNRSPVWTPDGRRLLCFKLDGNWAVAPADGSRPPITIEVGEEFRRANLSGDQFGILPEAWIPGTNEVVVSARSGDSYNLWTVLLSRETWKVQRLRRLTFGAGPEVQPSCDSNGRIAFANVTRDLDIWSLPVDANAGKATGTLQQLTHGAADDDSPSVSVDGKRMVFLSDRTGQTLVWAKDLETGEERMLTMEASSEPKISADGAQVAYKAGEPIYVVPFPGGTPRKVGECRSLRNWMPDGRSLLCRGWTPGTQDWLEMLDISTGRKTVLVRIPDLSITNGSAAPGGGWIAFNARKEQQRGRQFIAAISGNTLSVQSTWVPVRGARWSPDGNRLWAADWHRVEAQSLDPHTKRMIGGAVVVYDLPQAKLSVANVATPERIGFSLARDKLVFTMGKLSGNVWMAEWRNPTGRGK